MCTDGSLRVQWDSLTVREILHFDSLECLAHVVFAAESDRFGSLEYFEKWPLAAKSENFGFFPNKVHTRHSLKRQV
jgi:hypothetical protein